jgi:hypothetical protein
LSFFAWLDIGSIGGYEFLLLLIVGFLLLLHEITAMAAACTKTIGASYKVVSIPSYAFASPNTYRHL